MRKINSGNPKPAQANVILTEQNGKYASRTTETARYSEVGQQLRTFAIHQGALQVINLNFRRESATINRQQQKTTPLTMKKAPETIGRLTQHNFGSNTEKESTAGKDGDINRADRFDDDKYGTKPNHISKQI